MANKIRGQKLLPAASPTTLCPSILLPVAENFCLLQQARHVADYDERISQSRSQVIGMIDTAESSIAALTQARDECPDELYAFVLSLLYDRWLT